MLNPLDIERVKRALSTQYMGRELSYRASIPSTNDLAGELARQGAAEGTLVIADHQSAGKGRLERQWLSPPNANLLMSLILRPDTAQPPLDPAQAQRLTMICSLALADAVEQVTGLAAQIKWPNDLLLAEKKVAGILTELGLRGSQVDYAIVGIGLNVNLEIENLSQELERTATSIAVQVGHPVEREALLVAFLKEVERRNEALKAGHIPLEAWRARLVTLGKWVTVTAADGHRHGDQVAEAHAEAVDEDGALLLRLSDGTRRRVLAGDVTLRLPQDQKD